MDHLQTRLDALSEQQLRTMVLRVAAQDPYFCDVFAMELGEGLNAFTCDNLPRNLNNGKPLPNRPTRPRTLSNTLVHFPPPRVDSSESSDQEDSLYHPGRLETEEYEFLTVTHDGRARRQVQTVSMWSCCNGEDTSAGCKIASSCAVVPEHSVSRPRRVRIRSKKRTTHKVTRA
ncbi:hypothetical protein NP233_g3939 [Leucocoprinus birnbaumii]|uniref:Uncharacterized protein n=1 Tax=Leucocoprinus birnbaumii TaxID=56174 RepID=A0AAD5VZE4_9AGAR|nr:hypothetical protein NP233_g3939 [Leucocoprinus birnbaumii]